MRFFHIVILGKFVRFFVLQLKLAIEKYKKIYYGNKSMVRDINLKSKLKLKNIDRKTKETCVYCFV